MMTHTTRTQEYIPKSMYIVNQVKSNKFSKKQLNYVEDLIYLERKVLHGIQGFADAMKFAEMKSRYEREYLAILKELDPKQYEKLKDEKRREEEEEMKGEMEYEARMKDWWETIKKM